MHPKRLRDGREAGEPRLWLPDREAPGLLVSRAIGDDLASTVGCTAQPSVRRWRLQPGDEYLVIASDGVWDMLANEEVRLFPGMVERRTQGVLANEEVRAWQSIE